VERHPAIRFSSDAFDDHVLHAGGELPGRLTLRGLTRPVSLRLLPSDCARPGRDCDIQVQGELSRKDFGMTAYRAFLRDGVEVRFRVRLRAEPAR
jgi:polyisoprenoid-binding protein YceI